MGTSLHRQIEAHLEAQLSVIGWTMRLPSIIKIAL